MAVMPPLEHDHIQSELQQPHREQHRIPSEANMKTVHVRQKHTRGKQGNRQVSHQLPAAA